MVKKILTLFVVLSFIFSAAPSFAENKWDNLLIETARVFEEMTEMPEEGIPASSIKNAYAIAIFPSVIGGGFIIGGKYGQGIVIARDGAKGSWGAPAVFNLGGASFGWQIGGQATDTVLIIRNQRGLDGLLSSKFKLGGDASVAAGPWGRDAQAATNLQLKGMIWSYSRSRGAFVGLKLAGSVMTLNNTANKALYGGSYSSKEILLENKVKAPASADRLLKDLAKY
ncbi:lipid-binding SYLF domain-containing protein [Candidatus Omnitrophota bacterium]